MKKKRRRTRAQAGCANSSSWRERFNKIKAWCAKYGHQWSQNNEYCVRCNLARELADPEPAQ